MWHDYVVAHKRCHKIQVGLEEHNFHDFTNREKVTFLLDGIRVNTLEAPISSITMDSSYREDFEKAQLQIAECIRMANDRLRHTSLNVAATYTGNPRGKGRRGGRNDRADHGGIDTYVEDSIGKLPNGEWNLTGIYNAEYDADASKLTATDKNFYKRADYNAMDPLEKRKVKLNQRIQRNSAYGPKPTAPPATVLVAATEVSVLTLSIAHMAKSNKALQEKNDELNRQLVSLDDGKSLFDTSSEDAEESNRNNGSLVHQKKRRPYDQKKRSKTMNTGRP